LPRLVRAALVDVAAFPPLARALFVPKLLCPEVFDLELPTAPDAPGWVLVCAGSVVCAPVWRDVWVCVPDCAPLAGVDVCAPRDWAPV